ncbi:hypothetical protein K443DRAFT_133199 [Laccaria amethystina LaAM-08-1]|uniref:Uncharacterized protein n=1 Tax=Laccaria amethystina LaAM-08-1 TaxID=1095629 RepID=A0A0C9X206_9AGAR|nr:hypothetical protein K443DRAFT_133199 [Laccaria amethystina LaAM-08-1]
MKTCQFSHFHFTPGGKTRTETRNTVVVAGAYIIQCRPFSDVDMEIDYIRKMSRQWIKSWQNPFATANWRHLTLVRCHPFDAFEGDHEPLIQCMLKGMQEIIPSIQSLVDS